MAYFRNVTLNIEDFDTEEDYSRALLEQERIQKILSNVDITDAHVARQLYEGFNQHPEMFRSIVGIEFMDVLRENSKDRKASFLINNLNKIIGLELEVFIGDLIRDTMKIIQSDGYIEYDIENLEIFINHIIVLRKLGFIFVNIQNGIIKIHMPKVVLEIIKNKIASMEESGINIEKKNINKFIIGFLNAYGMMSITEAYILITKLYKNISPEIFNRYIF